MSSTDAFLRTLAHLAAIQTGSEGAVLHHALYACMLAEQLGLSPAETDDRAAEPAWGETERAINNRARELIEQARHAARAAEHAPAPWEPNPGNVVTWAGKDGTWIVRGYEDDDFVWVHRPDVRMVPRIGRNTAAMVDLGGWRDEPEHQELAAVVELRPAEHRQDDEDADQHRARTGHLPNFGCCVTAEQRAAVAQ